MLLDVPRQSSKGRGIEKKDSQRKGSFRRVYISKASLSCHRLQRRGSLLCAEAKRRGHSSTRLAGHLFPVWCRFPGRTGDGRVHTDHFSNREDPNDRSVQMNPEGCTQTTQLASLNVASKSVQNRAADLRA